VEIPATDENITSLGRVVPDFEGNRLWFDWVGSKVSFRVVGQPEEVWAKISNPCHHLQIHVDVDGSKTTNVLPPTHGPLSEPIWVPLLRCFRQDGTITILQHMEGFGDGCNQRPVQLCSIRLRPQPGGKHLPRLALVAPLEPLEVIEFIGDSDTTGFANCTERSWDGCLSAEEYRRCLTDSDVGLAWSTIVAQELGYVPRHVACCSAGLTQASRPMQKMYGEALVSAGRPPCAQTSLSQLHLRQPELVVIYLGACDIVHIKQSVLPRDEFVTGYMDLLQTVHRHWPESPVLILVPHPSSVSCCSSKEEQYELVVELRRLLQWVVQRSRRIGLEVRLEEVNPQPAIEFGNHRDWAGSQHWSIQGHTKWANAVVPLIRSALLEKTKRYSTRALFSAIVDQNLDLVKTLLRFMHAEELNATMPILFDTNAQPLASSALSEKPEWPVAARFRNAVTAFHVAAWQGHDAIVKLILECDRITNINNALADFIGAESGTALAIAEHCGHAAVTKLLLGSERFTAMDVDDRVNPLHDAVGGENAATEVELLLASNRLSAEQVNAADWFGANALHTAATVNAAAAASALLASSIFTDSSVNACVSGQHRDWQARADTVQANLFRLHGECKDQEILPESGFNALHCAAFRGSLDAARVLLESPRFTAVNDAVVVEGCASEDPVCKHHGCNSLHIACGRGHLQVASLLLHSGCRFTAADAKNPNGKTVLHYAVASANPDLVRLLLTMPPSHGLDPDAQSATGQTALHTAILLGYEDIAVALLQHEGFAAVETRDSAGQSASDLALRSLPDSKVTRLLKRRSRTHIPFPGSL